MVSADGAARVAGMAAPDSTIWIAEVGSPVCNTALPAIAGNALPLPLPFDLGQAAQRSR